MSGEPHTPDLRASDADREAAADRLHAAAIEGRLDPAELDERLTAAYAARTCGELARLTADVTPPPPAPPGPPTFVRASQSTNTFAIASLVVGVTWLWWVGSALAVVFGHVALSQIKAAGGAQGGRGLAIAGLVLGYLGLLGFAAVVVAIVLGA
jgi:hypothetical protein